MLAATSGDTEPETRNAAIVVMFYCLGLRVSELCGLTIEDTDLSRGSALIQGKGRREREAIPLPAAVVDGDPKIPEAPWGAARTVISGTLAPRESSQTP